MHWRLTQCQHRANYMNCFTCSPQSSIEISSCSTNHHGMLAVCQACDLRWKYKGEQRNLMSKRGDKYLSKYHRKKCTIYSCVKCYISKESTWCYCTHCKDKSLQKKWCELFQVTTEVRRKVQLLVENYWLGTPWKPWVCYALTHAWLLDHYLKIYMLVFSVGNY